MTETDDIGRARSKGSRRATRRFVPEGVAGRRETRAELKASLSLLELEIREMPVPVIVFDTEMTIQSWNPAAERVFGYSAAEAVGRSGMALLVAPDTRLSVQRVLQPLFDEARPNDNLNENITKDGRTIVCDWINRPLPGPGGGVERILSIAQDVTERLKSAEDQSLLAAIVNSSTDAIVSVDLDGVVTTWNRGAQRILGFAAEDMIGRPLALVSPEGGPSRRDELLSLIRGGARDSIFEITRLGKDGAPVDLSVVLSSVRNSAGKIVGGSLIARDVTERNRAEARRREAETALRDMQAQVVRFERLSMLGEVTATIAHEVNQPLAAIATNSDASLRWLAMDPPNLGRARDAIGRINQDSHRAHQVIERSRALATRGETDFADVDLNDAIREIVLMTRAAQQKSDVTVVEDLRADLPLVHGNRIELQQVLLNLFLNGFEAMRATSEGERVLRVSTDLGAPGMVEVTVQDSGLGLDPATADRLFESFFTTKPDGTGLGLRISRSIVETHGGQLWATPGVPHGAVFRFVIPAVGEASPAGG